MGSPVYLIIRDSYKAIPTAFISPFEDAKVSANIPRFIFLLIIQKNAERISIKICEIYSRFFLF